jgi:hypothetical protein
MSNMSYCRFENTSRDLSDCKEALENLQYGDEDALSASETRHAASLVEDCFEIIKCLANASEESWEIGKWFEENSHNPSEAALKIIKKMNAEAGGGDRDEEE